MSLSLAELMRIETLEAEVAKLNRRVRIVHTCVWEDPDNPMQQGDSHFHFAILRVGEGAVSITAFPLFKQGTDRALRIENVVARTREDRHSDPSFEVHFTVVNSGNNSIDGYRLNVAQILPDVGLVPEPCSGFDREG